MRGEAVDQGIERRDVRGVLPELLWCADAHEVQVGELGGLLVGRGERQSTGGEPRLEELLEPRLVHRGFPGCERRDRVGVNVHAQDVVAEPGHARSMSGAEVAGAENGQAEGHPAEASRPNA